MNKQLTEIKTELKKLDQMSTLTESLTFMSNQFDVLRKTENKKKMENIEKENKTLRSFFS